MEHVNLVWFPKTTNRMKRQHDLTQDEVAELFVNQPAYRYLAKEHFLSSLGAAFGQADNGRHITAIFIKKTDSTLLIIGARDMNWKERALYS